MATIPEPEYRVRLNRFIAEHGGDMGNGFISRLIRHASMERRFREETGLMPGRTPSGAQPSTYRHCIKKWDQRPTL